MNTTIMMIPENFKIRKKADIKTFLDKCMIKGCRYDVLVEKRQVIFDKDKEGNISVAVRDGDLSDIFNPSVEVARTNNNCYKGTVEEYIWKFRKYINDKFFNR